MQTIKKFLNHQINKAIESSTGLSEANANVITTSKVEFGDYQANGIMPLAKHLKTNKYVIYTARESPEKDLR